MCHIDRQVFDQVTILFSYLLGFDEMCEQLSPFQLVDCINSVFFVFDAVVDKHGVFKVKINQLYDCLHKLNFTSIILLTNFESVLNYRFQMDNKYKTNENTKLLYSSQNPFYDARSGIRGAKERAFLSIPLYISSAPLP